MGNQNDAVKKIAWNAGDLFDGKKIVVRCTREVAEGEELTIAYVVGGAVQA